MLKWIKIKEIITDKMLFIITNYYIVFPVSVSFFNELIGCHSQIKAPKTQNSSLAVDIDFLYIF